MLASLIRRSKSEVRQLDKEFEKGKELLAKLNELSTSDEGGAAGAGAGASSSSSSAAGKAGAGASGKHRSTLSESSDVSSTTLEVPMHERTLSASSTASEMSINGTRSPSQGEGMATIRPKSRRVAAVADDDRAAKDAMRKQMKAMQKLKKAQQSRLKVLLARHEQAVAEVRREGEKATSGALRLHETELQKTRLRHTAEMEKLRATLSAEEKGAIKNQKATFKQRVKEFQKGQADRADERYAQRKAELKKQGLSASDYKEAKRRDKENMEHEQGEELAAYERAQREHDCTELAALQRAAAEKVQTLEKSQLGKETAMAREARQRVMVLKQQWMQRLHETLLSQITARHQAIERDLEEQHLLEVSEIASSQESEARALAKKQADELRRLPKKIKATKATMRKAHVETMKLQSKQYKALQQIMEDGSLPSAQLSVLRGKQQAAESLATEKETDYASRESEALRRIERELHAAHEQQLDAMKRRHEQVVLEVKAFQSKRRNKLNMDHIKEKGALEERLPAEREKLEADLDAEMEALETELKERSNSLCAKHEQFWLTPPDGLPGSGSARKLSNTSDK